MVEAVFCDLDDTLHSLRVYSLTRLKHVAKRIAVDCHLSENIIYHQMCQLYDEGCRSDLLNRVLDENKIQSEKYLLELVYFYRSCESLDSIYPDAMGFLNFIKQNNILAFLVTDGELESQKAKVISLRLKAYFKEWCCTSACGSGRPKPDSSVFMFLLQKYGIDVSKAIAIGDNPYRDFVELKKVGMITFRIKKPDGRFSSIVLEDDYEANYNVSSFGDIRQYINNHVD